MTSHPSDYVLGDEVLYSTRSCRRCSTAMTAGLDARAVRTWTCPSCGRSGR